MSIILQVSLLSGRMVSVETELDVEIETFKQLAQGALSAGKRRLVDSCGSVLGGSRTIRECGLKTGDVLTLHKQPVMIQVTGSLKVNFDRAAFAAVLSDGSVVTWGDAGHGGDSSAVTDQLINVQQI